MKRRLGLGLALSAIAAVLVVACGDSSDDSSADGEGGSEPPAGECERPSEWSCAHGTAGYCDSVCDGDSTKGFLFCTGGACYCGQGDAGNTQCAGSFDVNDCSACEAATDAGCCGLRYP